MRFYWIKTHFLVKKLFRNYIWDMPSDGKKVYLTFDDGPTPEITPWVLSQLKPYNAKATFFCIGKNIENSPELFRSILDGGHSVGNHTFNHVNGWHTDDATYLENVELCDIVIKKHCHTKLFRPPYGKLSRNQSKTVRKLGYRIVMWDILSADFDTNITAEKCLQNVLRNIRPGTIIIFHDSVKAFKNLQFVLPMTLQYLQVNGYECIPIEMND